MVQEVFFAASQVRQTARKTNKNPSSNSKRYRIILDSANVLDKHTRSGRGVSTDMLISNFSQALDLLKSWDAINKSG